MKYFSLFSGIGGFELGIQQAYESLCNAHGSEDGGIKENKKRNEGQRFLSTEGENISTQERPVSERITDIVNERPLCVGYSEIDKYAIATYQSHFPNHKNYGDITKINEQELPDFDMLVGGFPCQAFSIAGKRKGFEDTRGTLFFDIARIIKAKQPRLVFLENVKGLLSHDNGETFRTIIATLDELGYDLQWQVLNSKNHGVPQNRERIFIIGHSRGTPRPEVFPFTEGIEQTGDDIKVIGTLETDGWEKRFEQIRRVHGTDGIVPTIPTGTGGGVMTKIAIPEATKQGYAEATIGDSINLSVPNSKTRRGQVGKGISQTLDTGMQQYTLSNSMKIRRLTPTECERLQGFPEIEKYAILKVCKQVNANGAEITLNIKTTDQESVVQADVLIDCEENGVEIHNQGKLLLNAKNVEKKNWSHQFIEIEYFVQLLVGIGTIGEKITNYGEVESHQNEQFLIPQKNGKKPENLYGKEIMQPVGYVKKDLIILKELLKSITLNHLDTENLEQKLQTLSLFVIRAINGYIPKEILSQDTFTIGIKTKTGWTIGSDTQRYKQCGNAVTVNVIRDIAEKLLTPPTKP